MSDLNVIVADMSNLTLLEAGQLVKMLEAKWGVSASRSSGRTSDGDCGCLSPVVEERSEFSLTLKGFEPSKKISVIKEVRDLTRLGLVEAKALVETGGILKEGLSKENAEHYQKILTNAGANVELT